MKNQLTIGTAVLVKIAGTTYLTHITGFGIHKGHNVIDLDINRFCYEHQIVEIIG